MATRRLPVAHVSELIEHFSYVAIFLMLLVAGAGVPIPEEFVLLSSGVLAAHGTLTFWKALGACYAGVVAGDSVIYLVGSRLGLRAFDHPFFKRLFTPRLTGWIERHFRKHGILTVMAARHMAGVRAPPSP
jgi:membrane protein DedA with SNARE-associated domain